MGENSGGGTPVLGGGSVRLALEREGKEPSPPSIPLVLDDPTGRRGVYTEEDESGNGCVGEEGSCEKDGWGPPSVVGAAEEAVVVVCGSAVGAGARRVGVPGVGREYGRWFDEVNPSVEGEPPAPRWELLPWGFPIDMDNGECGLRWDPTPAEGSVRLEAMGEWEWRRIPGEEDDRADGGKAPAPDVLVAGQREEDPSVWGRGEEGPGGEWE